MRDKIIQALLIALLLWAGSQLVRVETLFIRIQGMDETQEDLRDSVQALIGLHLRPAED